MKAQKEKDKGAEWDPLADTVQALGKAHDNIKQKCSNPNNRQHKNYGGRGISFHQTWADDRALFVKEVIAEIKLKPSKAHSLDRINNEGNYVPGNIRWATKREQARNRRSSVMIEIAGFQIPRAEIAEKLGMRPDTAGKRSKSPKPFHLRVAGFENFWLEQLRETDRLPFAFDAKERRMVSDMLDRLPAEVSLAPVLWYTIRFWNEFAADAADGTRRPPMDPNVEFLASHIAAAMRFADAKLARAAAYRRVREAELDEGEESERVALAENPEPVPDQTSPPVGHGTETHGKPGNGPVEGSRNEDGRNLVLVGAAA